MLFFVVAGMEAWKAGVCFVSKGKDRREDLTTRDVSGSFVMYFATVLQGKQAVSVSMT